jgi:type IV pilus assembly protein PilC
MEYQYRARTLKGELEGGRLEAASREEAFEILRKRNLIVTYLEEVEKKEKEIRLVLAKKIKTRDLIFLFRQLSLLISAGVPLPESLRSVASQTANKSFRDKLLNIAGDVEGGSYLSRAFGTFPEIFSPFAINMIRTGELAGNLKKVLEYLADHLERQELVNTKVKGALYYPLFIIGVGILVILIMFTFVLPRMGEMFEGLGIEFELPLPTRILLGIGNFFGAYGWILISGLILGGFFLWQSTKTEKGKKIWDKIMVKLPIFGTIIQEIQLGTLAENLGTLLQGGIPIAQALDTVGNVIGNVEYAKVLFGARDSVRRGESITSSFARFRIIPNTFIQIISAGEKSGKLGNVLMEIAQFYEARVETAIGNLTTILTPLLITFIGVGVGFVAVSIIMPIYQMIAALPR